MNLQGTVDLAVSYKASPQIARVVSEDWCARELYCVACNSDHLQALRRNCPGLDFACPQCGEPFQLKSSRTWNQRKIVDAGYNAMVQAIRAERVPNLLVMQYSADWFVKNLLLVPSSFFAETIIEKRPPLRPSARRAGWIGCNILLERIPRDGKIPVVSEGRAHTARQVRLEFARARKLASVPPRLRGWALDVLNTIRRLEKSRFTLLELYQLEDYLRTLHPNNQNVRAKIRQQLQLLRDLGMVEFVAPGSYALRK
jgi:type II restriction enzyme